MPLDALGRRWWTRRVRLTVRHIFPSRFHLGPRIQEDLVGIRLLHCVSSSVSGVELKPMTCLEGDDATSVLAKGRRPLNQQRLGRRMTRTQAEQETTQEPAQAEAPAKVLCEVGEEMDVPDPPDPSATLEQHLRQEPLHPRAQLGRIQPEAPARQSTTRRRACFQGMRTRESKEKAATWRNWKRLWRKDQATETL